MESSSNKFVETINTHIAFDSHYIAFSFGNVNGLSYNDKYIYLWLGVKGDVHYCFTLYDKEHYTTSIAKLGNVLTSHFGCQIEVVNNDKERLKKTTNAIASLNKALNDAEQYSYYADFNQFEQHKPSYDSNMTPIKQDVSTQQALQNPLLNQEKLHQGTIQLSTYFLESHLNTFYIKSDELVIVHKSVYMPSIKLAFFTDDQGHHCRNKFIASQYMTSNLNVCNVHESFILTFIFFMAKKEITQATKILVWIADIFTSLNKLPFALVLHSENKLFMQLFFEEIVMPLMNTDECTRIESDSLDQKSLIEELNEKFIYNFDNIVSPKILNEPAYELTNNLLHKDSCKIGKKVLTTVGNILITSTTNYIPLISDDVPSAIIRVSSSIDELCSSYNIRANKHAVADMIKNDLTNFVSILRYLDIDTLCNQYHILDDQIHGDILDGDVNPTKVFNALIQSKDLTPFKEAVKTKTDNNLLEELEENFHQNRVDKAHLLNYFELLFGKAIYKSNKALIKLLRDDYSKTGEPFNNDKTHVRQGRGYYFL